MLEALFYVHFMQNYLPLAKAVSNSRTKPFEEIQRFKTNLKINRIYF